MALKVYIEFAVKGAEKISAATGYVGTKLIGLSNVVKSISQGLKGLGETMTKAFTMPIIALTGLAAKLAMMAPKTKAMEAAFSNLRGVGVGLGQQFQRILVPVVNILADIIAAIVPYVKALADAFTSLTPRTQRLVVIFTALLAAIGPIIKILSSMIAIGGTIIGVFGKLATAISVLRLATLGWVAGLIAAGGALLYVYNLSTQLASSNPTQVMMDLGAGIITAEEAARRLQAGTVSLGKAWTDTLAQLSAFGNAIASVIPSFDDLGVVASNAFGNVAAGAGTASSALQNFSKASQKYISGVIVDMKALNAIAKDTSDTFDELTNTVMGGKSRSNRDTAGQEGQGSSGGDRSPNAAIEKIEETKSRLESMLTGIRASFSTLFSSIIKDTQDAGQALEDFFASVGDNILNTLSDIAANEVMRWIMGGRSISEGADSIMSVFASPQGGTFSSGGEGQNGGGSGGGMFGGLQSIFDMFLGGGGGANGEEGKGGGLQDIFDTFLTGISEIFGGGEGGGEGSFLSGLVGIFTESWDLLSSLFESAWSLLSEVLWPMFWELIVGIYDLIAALIVDAISPFATGGSRVVTRPTRILVGEAGPEKFTATPLGQSSADDEGGSVQSYVPQPMVSGGNVTVVLGQGAIVDGISQYRFANTIARSVRGILGRTV